MPGNSLTRDVSFKVAPVVLETLIKHYFDRARRHAQADNSLPKLRQDELLYDQAFTIVKQFLHTASFHTVEEVQAFANMRTPSPPWVVVVRVIVPMSCCDEAADVVIKAFGGEEAMRRIVGGTKWWQVRGSNGFDGQWITSKKDWKEAKRRHKAREGVDSRPVSPPDSSTTSPGSSSPLSPEGDTATYDEDMDEMRCILYSHGGGYYFGSVDQERYSIQRHARKINGRVFAVNYRLAPQYPFPCAIQDLVAAYLYLIRPPPGAAHRPVKPSHIIVSGDSAGGGLSLALLQVLRDGGLPLPAGGVLISPWCDLTHSFPSIHTNRDTDVIPPWGLSLQKPSTLWPPPPEDVTLRVYSSLRTRIRATFQRTQSPTSSSKANDVSSDTDGKLHRTDQEQTQSTQTISVASPVGENLTVNDQVHLYAQNSLLPHPLISPALSYLGGLPPLLVIASDREVLRDEILYTAHKAANPAKYPITEKARTMYPSLVGIEERYKDKPTQVHLQVYDDAAHVLPVLFSFTTPAKYCYRAIASFCKHVTATPTRPQSPTAPSFSSNLSRRFSSKYKRPSEESTRSTGVAPYTQTLNLAASSSVPALESPISPSTPPKFLGKRSLSARLSRASSLIVLRPLSFHKSGELTIPEAAPAEVAGGLPNGGPSRTHSSTSSDVGGPRFRVLTPVPPPQEPVERVTGERDVYGSDPTLLAPGGVMIRERISTQGVIRPLEPESEVEALNLPPESIGVHSQQAMLRYLDGRTMFDRKYHHTIKSLEKHRQQALQQMEHIRKDGLSLIPSKILNQDPRSMSLDGTKHGVKEGLMASSGMWSWAWAMDGEERPPPSSIVARGDMEEARRLAAFAEHAEDEDCHSISGNSFWSAMVNYFTNTPDQNKKHTASSPEDEEGLQETPICPGEVVLTPDSEEKKTTSPTSASPHKSRLSRFLSRKLHRSPVEMEKRTDGIDSHSV